MTEVRNRKPISPELDQSQAQNALSSEHALIVELTALLKAKRAEVHLLRAPLSTLTYFGLFCWSHVVKYAAWLRVHLIAALLVLTAVGCVAVLHQYPGPLQSSIDVGLRSLWFAGYWLVLGVMSSVMVGTGLHTFVLFLGPHIARTTLAATACGSMKFDANGICETSEPGEGVSMLEIYLSVQLAALLWGIGTAIGELPPYFVARAARLAGQESEEELELEAELNEPTIAARLKKFVYTHMKDFGFFGILLFASVIWGEGVFFFSNHPQTQIPNPLFDLAGIACGHFLVPFSTFFGATLIGKAFVKANLQAFSVIVMFRKDVVASLVDFVGVVLPQYREALHLALEAEMAKYRRSPAENAAAAAVAAAAPKSGFSLAWDAFLVAMLSYFAMAIVNSSVQSLLLEWDTEVILKAQAVGHVDPVALQKLREKYGVVGGKK